MTTEPRTPIRDEPPRDVTPGAAVEASRPGPPAEPIVAIIEDEATARRIRKPIDLLRLIVGLLGLALLIVIGVVLVGTTEGIESDVDRAGRQVPGWVGLVIGVPAAAALLGLPIALAVRTLMRGQPRQLVEAVLAAVLGFVASYWASYLAIEYAPAELLDALYGSGASQSIEAAADYLTGFAAFATVLYLTGRSIWRTAIWVAVAAGFTVSLLYGTLTALGAVALLLLGRTIGVGVRYAAGIPNTRPPAAAIIAQLVRFGLVVRDCRRVPAEADESRAYLMTTVEAQSLFTVVLDRDQQGAGLLYVVWRRMRLRTASRRTLLSLRQAAEHQALLAYAAMATGASTPRLLAVTEVGPDAIVLAYEHFDGVSLAERSGADVTDSELSSAWQQVVTLHEQGIAHRHLIAVNVVFDRRGQAWLIDISLGEIAAGELLLRLDRAQLLTELALHVGVERAVRSGVEAFGTTAIAQALPLLQPIALSRSTRLQLRGHRDLLSQIRKQVAAVTSTTEVEPVRLERLRPRTLVTLVATVLGAYFLVTQLAQVDLVSIVTDADWRWGAVAVVLSIVTYVGGCLQLSGFVLEKLRFRDTFLIQVAASFVTLVAPAAVGGVAVNARYLQRRGLTPALAVASVGVSQLAAFTVHALLLVVFVVLTGTTAGNSFGVPSWVGFAAAALLVVVAVFLALPIGRRLLRSRIQPTLSSILPRLLDVVQRPGKLAEGLGGALLVTLTYALCLYASIRALGGTETVVSVVVVYLAGSALGSAAPTPGGLGAIEAALAAGLTATGLAASTAVPAVLLFRLVTFWVPVLPGWLAFQVAQRRELL